MKQVLVRCKTFVLMLLAATLLFATGMTAHAQQVSEVYGGTIPNPTSLIQDTITVLQTPTPFDSLSYVGSESPFVGPTTGGEMYLSYVGMDGNKYHPIYPISIDNTTEAMTVTINGTSYPVSSLADVFSVLPEPPAPAPATLGAEFDQPVAVAFGGDAEIEPDGSYYITDSGVKVNTQPWGGPPNDENYTDEQCMWAINADTPGLYARLRPVWQPIGNNFFVRTLPTWSYDCHGFTFTSTDAYGTGAQWMTGDQVQFKILNPLFGNKYQAVSADQAQKGDILIYFGADGNIAHSGVVQSVVGGVITIRSKWGPLGLYDHAPADVLKIYGQTGQYFHPNRAGGNLLKKIP